MLYKSFKFTCTLIMLCLVAGFSYPTNAAANTATDYYSVKRGDTLYKLAEQFDTTVHNLIQLNQIRDPKLLQIGQKLILPKSKQAVTTPQKITNGSSSSQSVYQIKKGDTFYHVARRFGVSMDALLALNPIDPKFLQIGQKINIPTAASAPVNVKSISGQNYSVKQILNSTLTAYTAGYESTGKTSDHPQYGITYSGKRVQEGRTIAVDPSVISLGTKVYIEGVGLRVAEDIGSAIKGSKIDVFIDDLDEALEFGVKRNVQVYILSSD